MNTAAHTIIFATCYDVVKPQTGHGFCLLHRLDGAATGTSVCGWEHIASIIIKDKLCDKLNISFLDIINRLGLFRINCKQNIPLNKIVYLKDLVVVFDYVDKVNYREKIKYCIVCNIVKGDILLQK